MPKPLISTKKRENKIHEFEIKLPKHEKVSQELNLPLIQFWTALSRYRNGYDEDSIIHSALAVELALAYRLNSILTNDEKMNLELKGQGLEFGGICRLSIKKGILDNEHERIAWKINNLRNMFVHVGNWVQYMKDMNIAKLEEDPYFKSLLENDNNLSDSLKLRVKEIQDNSSNKLGIELLANAAGIEVNRLINLPDLGWYAKKDTLKIQREIMKPYFKKTINEMTSKGELNRIVRKSSKSPKAAVEYIKTKYNYLEPASFEILTDSFNLLVYLNYF